MTGSFKAEWRKLRQRPAALAIGGLLLALVALVGYIVPYFAYTHAGGRFKSDTGLTAAQQLTGLYPDVVIQHALNGVFPIGAALALVLGSLVAGSEYTWGTLGSVFTQGPSRLQTLAGRAAAVAAGLGVGTIAYWAVAGAGSLAVALLRGHAVTWPPPATVLEGLAATWLIFSVWAAIGMGLAFLLRSAPAAIGIGVAYLLAIEGVVFTFLVPLGADVLRTVEKFFPGPNVSALIDWFGPSLPVRAPSPLVDPWQAVGVLVLYLTAAAALAAAVVRRRDVAS